MAEVNSDRGEIFAKGCGCILGLIFLGFIAFCIYVLAVKPEPVWGKFTNFVNGEVNYEVFNIEKSVGEVQNEIITQVKNIGVNDVYISEKDLSVLLRNKFPSFKEVSADIKENEIDLFWKLDDNQNPVVGKAVLVVEDQNRLKITQLGTPRFYFPQFSYIAINNLANSIINQEAFKDELKIANSENLKIQDVQFQEGRLYLKILVDVTIF